MNWYRIANNPKDGSVVKCNNCGIKVWVDSAKRMKVCPNGKCNFDGDKKKLRAQQNARFDIKPGEGVESVLARMKERG